MKLGVRKWDKEEFIRTRQEAYGSEDVSSDTTNAAKEKKAQLQQSYGKVIRYHFPAYAFPSENRTENDHRGGPRPRRERAKKKAGGCVQRSSKAVSSLDEVPGVDEALEEWISENGDRVQRSFMAVSLLDEAPGADEALEEWISENDKLFKLIDNFWMEILLHPEESQCLILRNWGVQSTENEEEASVSSEVIRWSCDGSIFSTTNLVSDGTRLSSVPTRLVRDGMSIQIAPPPPSVSTAVWMRSRQF